MARTGRMLVRGVAGALGLWAAASDKACSEPGFCAEDLGRDSALLQARLQRDDRKIIASHASMVAAGSMLNEFRKLRAGHCAAGYLGGVPVLTVEECFELCTAAADCVFVAHSSTRRWCSKYRDEGCPDDGKFKEDVVYTKLATAGAPQDDSAVIAEDGGALNGASGRESVVLQWNVHYRNKDVAGISQVIKANHPDIVGLCELTVPVEQMAAALSAATGRNFRAQPGRGGWVGYGTDIFYDDGSWLALDGGAERAACASHGGPRAANWAALKERATGRVLLTGGIHLSYCAHGCDALHACELGALYSIFERLRGQYPDARVAWMGDLNRGVHTKVVQDLFQGRLGSRGTFKVDDLARTRQNTYFSGGSAIDHIFGDSGAFEVSAGGRTGQGVTGMLLNNADHFPIFARLRSRDHQVAAAA